MPQAQSVGAISLDMNLNSKGFNKQVDGIGKSVQGKFSAMSMAVGNIMSQMMMKVASEMGHFVTSSIEAGSDLTELENVVTSVFPNMSNEIQKFSDKALDSFGLTQKQTMKMIGTFGAMSESFGYTEKQSLGMSEQLTALAGDVASFYNLQVDESYTKLKSVFTGETESLKELGVVMTQTALDQFAMEKGFGKTTAKMTEQEKVALRLAFVQDKLSKAQGDVARTSDSWANQMRRLNGQLDAFKTQIGQGLINLLTPAIKGLNILMGKLVQLGTMFNKFTAAITGKKAQSASSPAAGLASDLADAAESAGETADGTKKAAKSLAAVDEINKLSANDDSSSGGGVGDSGFDFDLGDVNASVEEVKKNTNAALDDFIKRMQALANLFEIGFKQGLGDDFEASLERIKGHIDSIGATLREIFTDGKVQAAANKFLNKLALNAGRVAGSFASVGASIAEFLVGGIDKYLQSSKEFLKTSLIQSFDAASSAADVVGHFAVAFADFFEVFRSDTAKSALGNFIGIFADAYVGINTLLLKIKADILDCMLTPFTENVDKFKTAAMNILAPLDTVLGALKQSVDDVFTHAYESYDKYVGPMFDNIRDGLTDLVGTLLDLFNTHIAPVLQNIANSLSNLISSHLTPFVTKVIDFIGRICNLVGVLWKQYLEPIIAWIANTLIPVIAPILDAIAQLVINFVGNVLDILGGIIDMLSGIIDFITGVLTGDMELAWSGIELVFQGASDVICGIIQAFWDLAKNIFTLGMEAISGIITTAINLIVGFIQMCIENIRLAIVGFIAFVSGMFTQGFQGLIGLVTNSFSTIRAGYDAFKANIHASTSALWASVVGAAKSGGTTIMTTLQGAFASVLSSTQAAWTGIKQAIYNAMVWVSSSIKSPINTILSLVQRMADGITSAINSAISALNSMSFDVPDIVPVIGGKHVGFNLSPISKVSIPHLAQGGYARANQPQLAVVGDNRTQGEITAPEGKISEAVDAGMSNVLALIQNMISAIGNNNGNNDTSQPINIYLGNELLDTIMVSSKNRLALRSGGRA